MFHCEENHILFQKTALSNPPSVHHLLKEDGGHLGPRWVCAGLRVIPFAPALMDPCSHPPSSSMRSLASCTPEPPPEDWPHFLRNAIRPVLSGCLPCLCAPFPSESQAPALTTASLLPMHLLHHLSMLPGHSDALRSGPTADTRNPPPTFSVAPGAVGCSPASMGILTFARESPVLHQLPFH